MWGSFGYEIRCLINLESMIFLVSQYTVHKTWSQMASGEVSNLGQQ
jgi:hypothetical protein